ncbi:MAG TPA: RCC1 domain-containing protein [Candidatus Limnocylindrales bacterium]|nr:RCC1 domain-containing protein [Candidatus Limnocylindrales bacterium]
MAVAAERYRVVAWGDIQYDLVLDSGQRGRGAPLWQIAAGDFHSLALKRDGSVFGWGDDSFRQTEIPPILSTAWPWCDPRTLAAGPTRGIMVCEQPGIRLPLPIE